MSSRLTLYGSFTSSSSYKPMLFLSFARLPFSFRTVNIKKGVQNEPAHLARNRYGKVPVLEHNGLTIVNSNIILDYLARTTGHFDGATDQERWTAREWCAWEADAISNVAKVRHYSRFREVHPEVMAYFRPEAEGSASGACSSRRDRRSRLRGRTSQPCGVSSARNTFERSASRWSAAATSRPAMAEKRRQ